MILNIVALLFEKIKMFCIFLYYYLIFYKSPHYNLVRALVLLNDYADVENAVLCGKVTFAAKIFCQKQLSLCTTTSEPSTQIPPLGSRLSWVHRNWMPLPATAHFSSYVVFIALSILCCFLRLVCLPPSTAADLSTHLCSPQTYIPLGRLSILNVWLLDYTFLDFMQVFHARGPLSWNHWAPVLQLLKFVCSRARALQQEKPLQ